MGRAWARATGVLAALVVAGALVTGCGGGGSTTTGAGTPRIVATTPILGSIVAKAVAGAASVEVVMPNGSDPHEWRPSAKDVALLQDADLIVENGLGLEAGLTEAIAQARSDGVPVFTATDHVDVRTVAEGEVAQADGGRDEAGAKDPHFWTDPVQVIAVVKALPAAVRNASGVDVSATAAREARALAALDAGLASRMASVPEPARGIVTGHESLGYLARRYGYRIVGAVTPSLSSQGQVSAAHIAGLRKAMDDAGVRVVFAETGTSDQVARAVSDETGATLVELPTHALPGDGSYGTYISELVRRISSALANAGGK